MIALISLANPALLPASVERDTPQVGGEPIRGLRQRRKRANAELALKDLTDGGWFGEWGAIRWRGCLVQYWQLIS